MDKNLVRINQGRIFPGPMRFGLTLTILMLMTASLMYLSQFQAILTCMTISFAIPFFWSSYYLFEIDTENMQINEMMWFMGVKTTKSHRYTEIEKIYINPVNTSQVLHSYGGRSTTLRSKGYNAYLKTTDGDKYYLLSGTDPEFLEIKLKKIINKLNCPVIR